MTPPTLYPRPREKLQLTSIEALTDHELLQLIIGTGTKHQPVNRVARRVLALLQREYPTYSALTTLRGIGLATAARIVACFELVKRFSYETKEGKQLIAEYLAHRRVANDTVIVMALDGAGRYVVSYQYSVGSDWVSNVVHQVIQPGIASIVVVYVACQSRIVDIYDLSRRVYRALTALGLASGGFWQERQGHLKRIDV